MLKKPTRTISGVAPIAIMVPPRQCPHGVCVYCPVLDAPQSYTPESPVVLRAKKVEYDSYNQVKDRLIALEKMGHPTDKVEIIVMGGTFLSYPIDFQYKFIKECYDALNGKVAKSLEEAKKINESAEHRCVALCIETRPDFCGDKEIKRMMEFGCTRVELGVQILDDKIYYLVNRGHKVQDVIDATLRLKKAGFKVGYHMMQGLPGSNPKYDLKIFKELFKSEKYRSDQLKLYPCQVIKGAALENWYKSGKYIPYNEKTTQELLITMLKEVPEYCRVMRIMREIPTKYLVAGTIHTDARRDIEQEIRRRKIKIHEIRFREIGFALREGKEISPEIKIKKTEYNASGGKEIFLQAVNKDNILFGLLRLRLEKDKKTGAMVRELHVYGPALDLGERDVKKYQHRGLGKQLMELAEQIARKDKKKSIRVISGVGVREYYSSIGYKLDEEGYMTKMLL
jgi:elongator complex protein 3